MRTERKTVLAIVTICTVVLVSGIARADWFEGDDHKMHFPQLPDPFGWDVMGMEPMVLADDWLCTPLCDIQAGDTSLSRSGATRSAPT